DKIKGYPYSLTGIRAPDGMRVIRIALRRCVLSARICSLVSISLYADLLALYAIGRNKKRSRQEAGIILEITLLRVTVYYMGAKLAKPTVEQ
ncbi:MAG: hypothetical protein ACRDC4_08195, partial [Plesiomonas sp.]